MAEDGPSSGRRKLRFNPKAPNSSRKPKLTAAKSETIDEDGEAAMAQHLLERFNENQTRRKPKVEKKPAAVQVAFGPGAPSSTSLRSFGTRRDETSDKRTDSRQRRSDDSHGKIIGPSPSVPKEDRADIFSSDGATEAASRKIKKEYREPWDLKSNYPITLPWRRPNSGDPELLDKSEFVDAEYDENTINSAKDLGLLEESGKEKMYLFQLPCNLPRIKQSGSRKGKEKAENSVSSERFGASKKGCRLEELPGGYVGKMLVYKSGAVKLKLGETLFDVSSGSDTEFVQHVAAFNTKDRLCCDIGQLGKKVVVTPDIPDIDSL